MSESGAKEKLSGIIVKGIGGLYEVESHGQRYTCRAKGSFRHEMTVPTVGDIVSFEQDGLISDILERKNLLIRPPLANLDILFCVVPAKNPSPDLFTLDKLISIAESSGIEPVIVITKSDLDLQNAKYISDIYQKTDFTVFTVSIYDNDSLKGLEKYIREYAASKISAFAGASGAGKSTLMNMLFPSLKLVTGVLSRKLGRGKHTTRSVDLYSLASVMEGDVSGYLADTPGFTMLDFERFDFFELEDLPYTFREFDKHIGLCRYTKCTHLREEGCSIVEAVKNGEIPKTRHDSYVSLYTTLRAKPIKSHKK